MSSAVTTSAMVFEETYLSVGQDVPRVVSGRMHGGRLANVKYVCGCAARERHELRACLLSAAVSVLNAKIDSNVLSSTTQQRDALLILRCSRHKRAYWPAARPAKAVAAARMISASAFGRARLPSLPG